MEKIKAENLKIGQVIKEYESSTLTFEVMKTEGNVISLKSLNGNNHQYLCNKENGFIEFSKKTSLDWILIKDVQQKHTTMKYALLQYRDGANYKTCFECPIPEGKELEVGQETTMEEMGFTQEQFFDKINPTSFDPEYDHNGLEVLEINDVVTHEDCFYEPETINEKQDNDRYQTDKEGEKFMRKCSVTGKGMNSGWIAGEGDMYFKYEKDALEYAKKHGYNTLQEAFDADFMYYTEWDEEPEFIVKNGALIEIKESEKEFPNGFKSWCETHHEIVSAISLILNEEEGKYPRLLGLTVMMQGTGGVYELAETLTDKFEKENKERNWDGEFFDVIHEFITNELK